MSVKEAIKLEIQNLLSERDILLKLIKENKKAYFEFSKKYQLWYSATTKIFESIAIDRIQEFKSYYLIDSKRNYLNLNNYVIQDYLQGMTLPYSNGVNKIDFEDVCEKIKFKLITQFDILKSISNRVGSILEDVKGHLFSEIQDAELLSAINLLSSKLKLGVAGYRAAGVIAGVVLEKHLKRVAENHNISINIKEPTINQLNEKLNKTYDSIIFNKIQYLGSIRNSCCHNKDKEPTKEDVETLIDGVNFIIKNIF